MFSQLPLLQNLQISGVPSTAIPSIMACLPKLIVLDTDYHIQQHGNYHLPSTPLPHLQWLTIRVSSEDASGADELWNWTCSLIPHEGSLQSFSLMSFTITTPLSFVTRLIRRHGWSLTQFRVGLVQVALEVLIYLCRDCPDLALLECSVARVDTVRLEVLSIPSAITKRFLANDRKSYRTRQEPPYTPVCLVDPSWCHGYGTWVLRLLEDAA